MYKVLIVEDDPMVAMINGKYINQNELFTVVGNAKNGEMALAFLQENEVDLVVLDVFMPRTNGLEVFRKIREKRIPTEVIMVTAANDTQTVEEALHLGAVDYLVKPFSPGRLNVALEKFVSQTKKLKNNNSLDQKEIDSIIDNAVSKIQQELPKGIQEQTCNLIISILETSDGWLTGDDIAQRASLSSVTVRRYLNYLTESGKLKSIVNYETGGRPCMLYRIIS